MGVSRRLIPNNDLGRLLSAIFGRFRKPLGGLGRRIVQEMKREGFR